MFEGLVLQGTQLLAQENTSCTTRAAATAATVAAAAAATAATAAATAAAAMGKNKRKLGLNSVFSAIKKSAGQNSNIDAAEAAAATATATTTAATRTIAAAAGGAAENAPNGCAGGTAATKAAPAAAIAATAHKGAAARAAAAGGAAAAAKFPEAVALDCEMVGCGEDGRISILAQVGLVDEEGRVLINEYVKPQLPVTDLRAHITGKP
ncbi:exonuclease domain-containing protein, putative [Eimeria maxima]|uniref:Exonuclease domain-containing protein, putative n=1 Tax=Eimeria maxima TaxID=5804 RepID=U6M5T2_EIMMA|nr:exonuclease domain-containing protein, putative [Eimeria maxima]CDJ57824.1 exonuclease domain-containing protein, putative [Eimeria maxima]